MSPKPKTPPVTLSRERLVELMGEESADELLAHARGEHVDSVEMSPDDLERWVQTGEWPESSD